MNRTVVSLDPDVDRLLARAVQERGITFNKAVNHAIRVGLAARHQTEVPFTTCDMGESHVDISHASRLAFHLEDDEIIRKLAVGR